MFDIKYDIIDFHTHAFLTDKSNICSHKEYCNMSAEHILKIMDELNISYFCGSVIGKCDNSKPESMLKAMYDDNNEALTLRKKFNGRYIPGFHINPNFVKESIEEIKRMNEKGVKLIGELVPYSRGWSDYSSKQLSEILDVAEKFDMVVSFHSQGEDEMDKMVKEHSNLKFVAAHPGEYNSFMHHVERFKMSENYYLDLSGYGIFRYGMLRHLIDAVGCDRILYGSDFPTCNPGMYVGGILFDRTIKDEEKEKIFSLNAKKLLGL